MKKLLAIAVALLGLLALLFAAVIGYGWTVPADHVASSTATFARAPDEVWARLADLEAWPGWNGAFDAVERLPDRAGRPSYRFEGGFGPMPMVVESSEAPLRMVTRIPADADLGFHGTWTYVIAPAEGGGTTLTVTEEGHVGSVLLRGIGALFMDHHDTMNAFLVDLGRSFDEDTTPREVDV